MVKEGSALQCFGSNIFELFLKFVLEDKWSVLVVCYEPSCSINFIANKTNTETVTLVQPVYERNYLTEARKLTDSTQALPLLFKPRRFYNTLMNVAFKFFYNQIIRFLIR